jgi:hypothetical protein
MLQPGDPIPDAHVFDEERRLVSLRELAADGPMMIFMYIFDWSST